jgi:hypothetical protein
VERAEPQKPGVAPPPPEPTPAPTGERTDYLAQLRADYERRMRTELSSLRLSPPPAVELDLPGLVALLETCREVLLGDVERSMAARFWRKLRPLDPAQVSASLDGARRRLGPGLHLDVYLQALETQLVRTRSALKAKGGQP